MLVAKKTSGIVRPEHMDGKRVGLWGDIFQVQPKAFFRKFRVDVQVIPQTYSVNLFLRGGVDVASAMWYNEYHTILNCGLNSEEISSFFFQDYDLNFPEDGIYTVEETFHRDPDLCRAFVRASIRGWDYVFAHPEEALEIVMERLRQAHLPASMVHQRWMLARMKDIMVPPGLTSPIGRLAPEDYDRVTKVLMEAGLIAKIPSLGEFYKDVNASK
jgi:NitT/TauT family transport system substrate-binding protein